MPRSRASAHASGRRKETLAFVVEVENKGGHCRIVARAGSSSLARAIFEAACAEFPGRTLVLRNDEEILARRTG